MKKTAGILVTVTAIVFFGIGIALAGIPKYSSSQISEENNEKIIKEQQEQALLFCESKFQEYEKAIRLAIKESNYEILLAISSEFFVMADNEYGSLDVRSQYLTYIGINLFVRAERLRGKKLNAEIGETFRSISAGLSKIMEAHNMKLPLLDLPPESFEKVGLGKCLEHK